MTLTNVLNELTVKELEKLLNSNKEYIFFNISVFNVGVVVTPKCTNVYKEINYNIWNGYDFLIENDSNTNYYIQQVLNEKLINESYI